MRRILWRATIAVAGCLLLAAAGQAETKVTVSETHLCCGQCLRGVEAALKDVPGVKHKSSQEAKTIEITADNDEAAQKAIDALAAAGFYGKVDHQKVKFKAVDAPQATVERLEVTGVHNCCGACTRAIQKAVSSVAGVQANTAKAKEESFVVEGKFKPTELVDALLKAGFYVQLKK